MGRIRVACVSGYTDVVGGGQVSALELLRRLDRERFLPALLCAADGEMARRARALGVEVAVLDCRPLDSVSAAAQALSLRRAARRLGADVLHCDTLYTGLAAGLAVLGTGIRVIFHARTAESGGALDRLVPALCAMVICVSEAAAARFAHRPPSSIRVVFNGVDLSQFRPGRGRTTARERLGIPADTFAIGYCGQLIREKGLGPLREAFARLRGEAEACVLLLKGRGPEEAAVRSQRDGGVRLLPFSESMPDFYAALDVFVLPTLLREGLSRTLIEAMACGVPCITTPLGGNSEVVLAGRTGLFVPPGDASALHHALRDLQRDRDRREGMGRAARARAEQVFDLSECVRRVEEVYLQVAA